VLFSERSIATMMHGIVFGGVPLMGLAAALFYLYAARAKAPGAAARTAPPALAWVLVATAVALWFTVIAGTFVVFPWYRTPPPADVADLGQYPRAFVLANPGTAWLHRFAMETKEHMPWIAAILGTAAAFVTTRYRSRLLDDDSLRNMTMLFLAVCLAIVAWASLLGVFVNKVAPVH
jgi:uncharacterized membrane-anchored protein